MKGNVAKSMVRQEFADVVKVIIANPKEAGEQTEGPRLYSWDNASVNLADEFLPMAGLEVKDRWPLAAYSPDCHKVIEHVFHILKVQFQRYLADNLDVRTAHQLQEALRKVFYAIDINGIRKDVESLELTYGVVAAPVGRVIKLKDGTKHIGVGGGWPLAKYR